MHTQMHLEKKAAHEKCRREEKSWQNLVSRKEEVHLLVDNTYAYFDSIATVKSYAIFFMVSSLI